MKQPPEPQQESLQLQPRELCEEFPGEAVTLKGARGTYCKSSCFELENKLRELPSAYKECSEPHSLQPEADNISPPRPC